MISGDVSCRLERNICFKTFVAGSYFGEIELLQQTTRKFSVRAEDRVTLAVLDREKLLRIMQTFPRDAAVIWERSLCRYIKMKQAIRKIRWFEKISMNNEWWTDENEKEHQRFQNKVSDWLQLFNHKSQTLVYLSHSPYLLLTQLRDRLAEVFRLEIRQRFCWPPLEQLEEVSSLQIFSLPAQQESAQRP